MSLFREILLHGVVVLSELSDLLLMFFTLSIKEEDGSGGLFISVNRVLSSGSCSSELDKGREGNSAFCACRPVALARSTHCCIHPLLSVHFGVNVQLQD
jgi:hypothetical protein